MKKLRKPEKLYLGNTCLYFAYADLDPNLGSLRETFFCNCLRLANKDVLTRSEGADFAVDNYVFEVGGPNKGKDQLGKGKKAFVVKEISDVSFDPKILPLWLFGFLIAD